MATCNYLSFVNPSFDNKVVYARILDYDYINNECIEVSYAIDFWQTWMFDVSYDSMYIEREHLSEAEWDLAETNPYNPNIPEFRTAESLPISKDLEKLIYTIGTGASNDGHKIGDLITSLNPAVGDSIGAFIRLSSIDFTDLDDDPTYVTKPSQLFVDILTAITQENMGYYYLAPATYNYLTAAYPSAGIVQLFTGGWWEINGTAVSPGTTSRMRNECSQFYITHTNTVTELLADLTRWSCVSSIVDMYAIPHNIMLLAGRDAGGAGGAGGSVSYTTHTAKTHINVTNKKLLWYPFSYMRVISPNGDTKELQYEKFYEVSQQNTDNVKYLLSLDISDKPTLIVAPYKYKLTGYADRAVDDCNVFEGMYFAQFPTMPYTIDSYLTQQASLAKEVISNRTIQGAYDMESQFEKQQGGVQNLKEVSKFISEILGVASSSSAGDAIGRGVTTAGTTSHGWVNAGIDRYTSQGSIEDKADLWYGASKFMKGADTNAIARELAGTRAAYACDNYVRTNGNGVLNYNTLATCDILFLRVSLNPEILSRYDHYFSMYGYSSGRVGIARVIRFTQGASSSSELPHWYTGGGKQFTYVKTMDCKVTSAMAPVSRAIESMFDNGIRMIKGDLD
jgi:hypothetical protein